MQILANKKNYLTFNPINFIVKLKFNLNKDFGMTIRTKIQQALGLGSPFINIFPAPIVAERAPTSADNLCPQGQIWFDNSVTPPVEYTFDGDSTWAQGGANPATTTTYGSVLLTDNSEPVATKVYVDAVAIAGAPIADEVTQGIVEIATNAEAVAGTANVAGVVSYAITPSNLASVFAAPPATGGTTPAAGTFTSLTASGGTVSLASTAASVYDVTGAGNDLTLSSDAGRVVVNGEEAAADAVRIVSAAGGLDVDVALQMSLVSSQNAADAIVINASAGGVDITAAGAAGEDIDLVNTSGSINLTAGENTADSIVITSSAGGIDIVAAGAAAEDIDITCTAGSVHIIAGEAATDAITLAATLGGVTIDGAGDITVTSTQNSSESIQLHANGGTSETIKIHADQGTGVASLNLLSDVGGITLQAGLSTADAININASGAAGGIDIDSGTNGFIVDSTGPCSIDVSGASNFTVATGDLSLIATLSSVNITANEDAADAVVITSAAGGIDVLATGAAGQDIDIVNTGGSVNITATEDAADAVYIRANGGTSEAVKIHADQGTGAASINVLSDVGGITLRATGLASADAINLEAAAGGVDVDAALQINIASSQNAVDAIRIVSSAGGIDIDAVGAATEDINITNTGGSVVLVATEAASDAVVITASDTAGGVNITAGTGKVSVTGTHLAIATTGKGLHVKGGAATDMVGSTTLVLGTVTVNNTNIATGDLIFLQRIGVALSTTLGELSYTISNGASFTINSLILGTPGSVQTGDVSTVAYMIVKPI